MTKNLVGVERLAGANHVVPPADVVRVARVGAGDVVRGVQGVADEHGVRARGIQRAVGFVGDLELGQHRAALQFERFGEACAFCARQRSQPCSRNEKPVQLAQKRAFGNSVSLAVFVKRPQAELQIGAGEGLYPRRARSRSGTCRTCRAASRAMSSIACCRVARLRAAPRGCVRPGAARGAGIRASDSDHSEGTAIARIAAFAWVLDFCGSSLSRRGAGPRRCR